MKTRMNGKTVLITGASSGIGRAAALAFARQGASLALVARNAERLQAVAEEVRALGVAAEPYLADTSDQAQIESAVQSALARFGSLDAVLCNAGICAARPKTFPWCRSVQSWKPIFLVRSTPFMPFCRTCSRSARAAL